MTSLNISEYKIGVLGGMFNPPTQAHMQMAVEAINKGVVNEVIFVPSGNDPENPFQLDAGIRFKMVKMAVKDFFHDEFPIEVNLMFQSMILKVSDIEVENGVFISTYNLMKFFIDNQQPNEKYYFMMGQDLLENIQQWNNSEELLKEIPFLIFKRISTELDDALLPTNYQVIETTFVAAASTEIRQRIKRNLNITFNENQEKDNVSHTSFCEATQLSKKIPVKSGNLQKYEQSCSSFSQKYLGVFGLVPTCVINFIKDNKLYSD